MRCSQSSRPTCGRGAPCDRWSRPRCPEPRPLQPLVPGHGRRLATRPSSLAENNGTPELASLAAAVLALCSAVIGDEEMNRRAAALLCDVPEPERRALGPIGSAYLAFNLGRFEEADVLYRNVLELSPIGQGFVRWETEWIECLSRLGRRDEASAVLAELESVMTPELLVYQGVERTKGDAGGRAMTRRSPTSREGLAAAVQQDNRFAAGRVELAWGERLRRARRRAEARGHLEQAVELLRGSGCCGPRRTGHPRAARRRRCRRRRRRVASAVDAARAAGGPPGRRWRVEPRPGGEAVHQPTHRRGPPHSDLPQARCPQPSRARRAGLGRPRAPTLKLPRRETGGVATLIAHHLRVR